LAQAILGPLADENHLPSRGPSTRYKPKTVALSENYSANRLGS
jgi:hypothetical protein